MAGGSSNKTVRVFLIQIETGQTPLSNSVCEASVYRRINMQNIEKI